MVQPRSRDINLPVLAIAGVVVLALLATCCVGGIFYLRARGEPDPAAAPPTTSSAPSAPAPTPTPTPSATPLTGAACVLGRWKETSGQTDASIDGETVRLTWSGPTQTFTPDGVVTIDYGTGTSKIGTLRGNTYLVSSSGILTFHYQVAGNQILYSDSHGNGSTTWYRNGVVFEQQELVGGIGTETFNCVGDAFTQIGDSYTIDLVRT